MLKDTKVIKPYEMSIDKPIEKSIVSDTYTTRELTRKTIIETPK